MRLGGRELIVVGDRVLVRSEEGESMTSTGLILPASVADRESVQAGRIVAVGPGLAASATGLSFDDDWKDRPLDPRYVAMQARVGDLAVFIRKAAVEVAVEEQRLYVVSHGAILVLLRDDAGGGPPHVA